MNDLIYVTIDGVKWHFTKQEIGLTASLILITITLIIYFLYKTINKKRNVKKISEDIQNIKLRLTTKEYADIILKTSIDSEAAFFSKHCPVEYTAFTQAVYYIYTIYICENILNLKYNTQTSQNICNIALDNLLEHLSKKYESDAKLFKQDMLKYYRALRNVNFEIMKEHDGLLELAKSFISTVENTKNDAILTITIVSIFSAFIENKTPEIIDKRFELIDIVEK